MEEKGLEIDNPVAVAGVTIIPVAKVSLNYWHGDSGISFFGVKQPIDVVVISSSEKRAFRITGEEVSLDQLIQEVPGIEETVERI